MSTWNDDRLDELSRRTDEGFKEMRGGFARVDREMKEGFERVDKEMREGFERVDREMKGLALAAQKEMDQRFDEVSARANRFEGAVEKQIAGLNERFDRLTNTLIIASAGIVAAILTNGIFG